MTKSHLSEDERHGLADGSLSPDQRGAADEHVRSCAECAADVERIRSLMKRVDESTSRAPVDVAGLDEAWPSIRARIEQQKVVPLSAERGVGGGERAVGVRPRWIVGIGAIIAAGIMTFWLVRGRSAPVEPTTVAEVVDSGVSLVAVVDSTNAYQEEARALLNHFELARATMRPELARLFERDLRTIDVAIAELQDAVRSDPANPALRRLLASSYRQKVDLLKRASNAG